MFKCYRPLIWFWSGLLAIIAGVAATVQLLGPLPLPESSKNEPSLPAAQVVQRPEPTDRLNSQPNPGDPAQSTPKPLSEVIVLPSLHQALLKTLDLNPPSSSRLQILSARPKQTKVTKYAPPPRTGAMVGTFSEQDPKNIYTEPVFEQPVPSIGTYTTGADGVRMFVPNPSFWRQQSLAR